MGQNNLLVRILIKQKSYTFILLVTAISDCFFFPGNPYGVSIVKIVRFIGRSLILAIPIVLKILFNNNLSSHNKILKYITII